MTPEVYHFYKHDRMKWNLDLFPRIIHVLIRAWCSKSGRTMYSVLFWISVGLMIYYISYPGPEAVYGSLFDPHVFPSSGPFFEGWYMRITDFDNVQSVGLLFGSVLPANVSGGSDPLVVASILMRNCTAEENNQCKLVSVNGEFTPSDVNVTVSGHHVLNDPDLSTPANFRWQVTRNDHGGYFEQVDGETTFNFRLGDIFLRGAAKNPYPWNPYGTGPEGWLVNLPLPLHWFVFSLRSTLNHYEIQNITSGIVIRGQHGVVHLEKNWGKSFPPRWIWSEGVASETNSSFALSGGTVDFSVVDVDAYLVGYRNPAMGLSLDFRPDNSVISNQVDGCKGTINMTINSLSYKVEFLSKASPKTFSSCLLGPELHGFTRACVESYDAMSEFKIYKRTFIPWSLELIDQQTFTGVGLEFGGTYVCGNKCSK